jgi:amino-acid N-acetyltransferase
LFISVPRSQEDFLSVYELIKNFSEKKEMLPRSLDHLYRIARGLRTIKNAEGEVIACAHLDLFSTELAEIKSLAVKQAYQGKGFAKALVEDCEREAEKLSIKKVFALTYQEKFFIKLGYKVVPIDSLPEKVFKECVICPFFRNCNEIAVVKFI